MGEYLKTKAFSKLTGVSVRTLQYYDEIGLLKPAYTNEHGHRFYDEHSFSKMFIILSFKEMGMELQDIRQTMDGNSFDIHAFLNEEKQRTERMISQLQLRLMRLSALEEQLTGNPDISLDTLSLLSQLSGNNMSSEEIQKYIEISKKHPVFDLQAWDTFIQNLNDCCERDLPATDQRVIACIEYWLEKVIQANHVDSDWIKRSEQYYQNQKRTSFGITSKNYLYLMKVMDAYKNTE